MKYIFRWAKQTEKWEKKNSPIPINGTWKSVYHIHKQAEFISRTDDEKFHCSFIVNMIVLTWIHKMLYNNISSKFKYTKMNWLFCFCVVFFFFKDYYQCLIIINHQLIRVSLIFFFYLPVKNSKTKTVIFFLSSFLFYLLMTILSDFTRDWWLEASNKSYNKDNWKINGYIK